MRLEILCIGVAVAIMFSPAALLHAAIDAGWLPLPPLEQTAGGAR